VAQHITEDARSLLEYVDAAIASAANVRNSNLEGLRVLEEMHTCFHELCIRGFSRISPEAAALAMHSHSMFLAGTLNGVTGHAAAVYPILRACLESALYCLHIAQNPHLGSIWAERGASAEARRACRKAFGADRVLATAAQANPPLGTIVRAAYEELIDFGAHPNVTGVFKSLTASEVEEGIRIEMHYLHGNTPTKYEPLTAGLEVAVYAMALILTAFPDDQRDAELVARVQALIDLGRRKPT
jgi:hypothetical protein